MGSSESRPMISKRLSFIRNSPLTGSSFSFSMGSPGTPSQVVSKDSSKMHLDRFWIESSMESPRSKRKTSLSRRHSIDGLKNFDKKLNALAAVQTFKKHRRDILDITDNAAQFVTHLLSNDIIPEATKRRIIYSGLNKMDKSIALLDAIEARISVNPEVLHTLVALLQSDSVLKTFAAKLLESYRDFSETYAIHLRAIALPAIVRYTDFLKAYYKALFPLSKYKWPTRPTMKPFNLRLISTASRTSRTFDSHRQSKIVLDSQPITLRHLLKSCDVGEGCLVIVEGEPGVGKTSLTVELCRSWDEFNTLKKYSLVVLLRAQEKRLQEAKSLSEFFVHHNSNLQQNLACEVTRCRGKGLLLVIDGIDQNSIPNSSILSQILRGSCLPKCSLMLTCCSSSVDNVKSMCSRKVDRHVRILGFTQQDVEQHAESSLAFNSDILAGFHNHISSNPALKCELSSPLTTALAVEVFKKSQLYNKPPPTTLTELYNELAKYLLKHHLLILGAVDSSYVVPDDFQELPQKLQQQLSLLAKLAYNGLLQQTTAWAKLSRGCFHLGFMVPTTELYTRRASVFYRFLHQHVQEYLAALHIGSLPLEEQTEIYQKNSTLPYFDDVWRFLAARTNMNTKFWHCPNESPQEQDGECTLTHSLLHLLYEAHKKVSISNVVQSSVVSFPLTLCGEEITAIDCFRLGCCLAHSSNCLMKLKLRLDTEMLHHLILGLKSTTVLSTSNVKLDTLFLRPPITEQTVSELRGIPSHLIERLDLSHCNLQRVEVDMLASILPATFINIRHLDFRGNPIAEGGTVKLFHSLVTLKQLESLSMINTGSLHSADINALTSLLQSSAIRKLCIGDNELSPESVKQLVCATLDASSVLESVYFWFLDLEPHMMIVAEMLRTNSAIKQLEFHGCTMGSSGCCHLAEGLKNNESILTLVLSMFDVKFSGHLGTKGAVALAEMLSINQTLETFEIQFDRSLERNGTLSLAGALDYNHTLKSLKLPLNHQLKLSERLLQPGSRLQWVS